MTREEIKKAMSDTKKEVVLKNLHKLLSLVEGYPEYEDCVGYAIETLEQEPKSEWEHDHAILKAYSDGANEVLNKLRAEIEAIIGEHNLDDYDFCSGLIVARKLIDKYKADRSEEE